MPPATERGLERAGREGRLREVCRYKRSADCGLVSREVLRTAAQLLGQQGCSDVRSRRHGVSKQVIGGRRKRVGLQEASRGDACMLRPSQASI